MATTLGPPGVLVVHLGTPDAPTAEAVRRYLREFLSDPRVVDWPRWIWLPVLHGLVLRRRPPRSAELYRSVWTPAGSPLLVHARAHAEALARLLRDEVPVVLAMRYGRPSLDDGLRQLQERGCSRLLVLAMFPQPAGATRGSLEDALAGRPVRWTLVPPFPEDDGYLRALATSVRTSLAAGPVDHHVFSFHGLPARQVEAGDPYREACARTARALARRLELADDLWSMAFQSRFGPERWLEPATETLVLALARHAPRLLVTFPGFATDCLETLEEIGIGLRRRFFAAGGAELRLTPCLNADPEWVAATAALVRSAVAG